MTSYFDDITRSVSEHSADSFHGGEPDEDFLARIVQAEYELIRTVNLVTGDREFPDDLRQKIQGLIAVHRVSPLRGLHPRPRAVEMARISRRLPLLDELHWAFHEVARRRIETRFGLLTDSPRHILAARDEWEKCHLD